MAARGKARCVVVGKRGDRVGEDCVALLPFHERNIDALGRPDGRVEGLCA